MKITNKTAQALAEVLGGSVFSNSMGKDTAIWFEDNPPITLDYNGLLPLTDKYDSVSFNKLDQSCIIYDLGEKYIGYGENNIEALALAIREARS